VLKTGWARVGRREGCSPRESEDSGRNRSRFRPKRSPQAGIDSDGLLDELEGDDADEASE
jgi:hypothetical protein